MSGLRESPIEGLLRPRDFADALVVRLDHCGEIVWDMYPPIDEASARIVSMLKSEIEVVTARH